MNIERSTDIRKQTKENRQHKDSVFVDLFYNDETASANLLNLYNALYDTELHDTRKIRKLKIEDVLYKNFKNDISFEINGQILIFGEHQSTINKNMPLRCLMYTGRAYESLVDMEARYKEKLAMIPTPEFYVFYNGEDDYPVEQELCLSEAFRKLPQKNSLELKVRVININSAKQHDILKKCRILKEYSFFIDTIRKYQLQGKPEAIKAAILECIQEGVLKDYLSRKGSEVRNMLIAEYSYETDIKVKQQEAREDGLEKGRLQGKQLLLIQQVCKKLKKGQAPEVIAEALEEDMETIKSICEAAGEFAPDYDDKMIYEKINKKAEMK